MTLLTDKVCCLCGATSPFGIPHPSSTRLVFCSMRSCPSPTRLYSHHEPAGTCGTWLCSSDLPIWAPPCAAVRIGAPAWKDWPTIWRFCTGGPPFWSTNCVPPHFFWPHSWYFSSTEVLVVGMKGLLCFALPLPCLVKSSKRRIPLVSSIHRLAFLAPVVAPARTPVQSGSECLIFFPLVVLAFTAPPGVSHPLCPPLLLFFLLISILQNSCCICRSFCQWEC